MEKVMGFVEFSSQWRVNLRDREEREKRKRRHQDDRTIFVNAVPQEAKDTDIKEYFITFGEVENVDLKKDPMTGRSREFAFVVFKELEAMEAALAHTVHIIKDKRVTCKKAGARQGKVYVGKLPPGEALSKEDLQAHFEQFGSVVEVFRPVDKTNNNEPKTFAFINFAKEEAAKQLLKQGHSKINDNHIVEIKKVTRKQHMEEDERGDQDYGGQGGGSSDKVSYKGCSGVYEDYAIECDAAYQGGPVGKMLGSPRGAPRGRGQAGSLPY